MHTAFAQAAEAKDLALVQFKREILQDSTCRNVCRCQDDFVIVRTVKIGAVIIIGNFAANHVGTHFVDFHFLAFHGGNQNAVTQNRNGIADAHQFIKVMGDEQNCLFLAAEFAHDIIDNITSALRQCRRRLIHDKNLRMIVHGARNLYDFAILEVQIVDRSGGINMVRADLHQNLLCRFVHLLHA